MLQIEVSDSGNGIPEEHLNHVFERFYRVDASRSRSDGGTGLGLSICRSICEVHGGSILIASRLNEGTTVTVMLPLTARE
jgi:signal transduction histidine kinase